MPPKGERADAPGRWLENARADRALAKVALPPGSLYELLCFHAHQAAEKSLKALLLHAHIEFPFTHNLQALFDLVPAHLAIPPRLDDAVDLNPYAVATRYPGESEPVTKGDCEDAVRLAEAVTEWAASVIAPAKALPTERNA